MARGNVGSSADCQRAFATVDADLLADIKAIASKKPGGTRKELTDSERAIIKAAHDAGASPNALYNLLRKRDMPICKERIKTEYERIADLGGD